MIDVQALREGLQRQLKTLEDDICRHADEQSAVNQQLVDRYEAAKSAGRTALTFNQWRDGEITQAAVAWLLGCVFVRFLEDNGLIDEAWIAGPLASPRGNRLREAQERQTLWYRDHPRGDDRQYLEHVFTEVAKHPVMVPLFDRMHNPLWSLAPEGGDMQKVIAFFRRIDPDANALIHDFTDSAESTRFLGDLYQNISESARKRYALLQTPDFVVDFILDRTMDPAIAEFGLKDFRIIDPACGSGHFLISAFERLFDLWSTAEPSSDPGFWAERALASVYGVDLNPYAIAIARFRLLIAALGKCGIAKLSRVPHNWKARLAVGDSLLHGPAPDTRGVQQDLDWERSPLRHVYEAEDAAKLKEYLGHKFRAVVGNPPYITVQDPAIREAYRDMFGSCSGTYQLSVPFTERFFHLAESGERAGYVGMITSNAFIKRTFGKILVEACLPKWDVTHVIDTSRAFIPGHATPTLVIVGRNRAPVAQTVRVVRGIRGETNEPKHPASAPVWIAILEQLNHPGSESRWISVADADRKGFLRHPWSIGGGGASELKEQLDDTRAQSIEGLIGGAVRIGHEDVFTSDAARLKRLHLNSEQFRGYLIGENVRDWSSSIPQLVWFPYGPQPELAKAGEKIFWRWRTLLASRATFDGAMADTNRKWFEYQQFTPFAYRTPLSIAFAEIATHNHFVLDRGGSLFKQTAPIIKMSETANAAQHIHVLGLLNSSTACFWLRQVCYDKGAGGNGRGLSTEQWEHQHAFDATKVGQLPLPAERPSELATAMQALADERKSLLPDRVVTQSTPTRARLSAARDRASELLARMIALQEELDWQVYSLYKLTEKSITLPIDKVPPIRLGQRAFEIVMARQIVDGELETTWFERHGSTPIIEIPAEWPEPYRALVQRRLDLIASDRDIALIEQPEYKPRWKLPSLGELEEKALRSWLLDRLEDPRYWPKDQPRLLSVARLADLVRHDRDFLQVAELYTKQADFNLQGLVDELVRPESVPFLPVLRYTEPGLRKRADWETTWDLQRREDFGEKVEIPVPPKYQSADFQSSVCWRLRGKLDVPKERFVSYPGLERDADGSLPIAWAGYDHAQQGFALAAYEHMVRHEEAWDSRRLPPILAGVLDLLPWLKQWHNTPDPVYGIAPSDSMDNLLRQELSELGLSEADLRAWQPERRRPARKPKTKPAARKATGVSAQ